MKEKGPWTTLAAIKGGAQFVGGKGRNHEKAVVNECSVVTHTR